MAQIVRNLPVGQETLGSILGRDSLLVRIPTNGEERKYNCSRYSCLENHMDEGAWQAIVMGIMRIQKQLRNEHFQLYPFRGVNTQMPLRGSCMCLSGLQPVL